MEQKSFGIGMAVASAVWVFLIAMLFYREPEVKPLSGYPCDKLIMQAKVDSYAHGYYECLRDARPDIHMAYMSCIVQLDTVQDDSAFNSIVDAECTKHNLSAVDKEYLCTLLID